MALIYPPRQTIRRQSTCWWSWPPCRPRSSLWTRWSRQLTGESMQLNTSSSPRSRGHWLTSSPNSVGFTLKIWPELTLRIRRTWKRGILQTKEGPGQEEEDKEGEGGSSGEEKDFILSSIFYFINNNSQAARKAAGLDDSDDGGDIFTEGHDEDLLF